MTGRLGALMLLSLLAAGAEGSETALDAAVRVEAWLRSLEQPDAESGGLRWPISDRASFAQTGLDTGAAGIGTFYLRLFAATGSPDHLARARRAADYVFRQYEAGRLNGPDWLAGAAGGGSFFLDLYAATGDEVGRERARATAQALVRSAVGDAAAGYHWRHGPDFPRTYTGVAHGAAGIGLFLLRAYRATGDALFLQYAEGAFRWASAYELPLAAGGSGWKRLTTDTTTYHLWCGGSAGMVGFLAELYEVTGSERYREALRRTADGLLASARTRGDGFSWTYTSDNRGSAPLAYCHGAPSVALALYRAHAVLGDPRYLDYARGALRWVAGASARTSGSGVLWEHISGNGWLDTGYFTGTASVGRAFVEAFGHEADPAYLRVARLAADGLLGAVEMPVPGQARWPNYLDPPRADSPRAYETGLYSGVAGIGAFFLDLHAAERAAAGARR